MVVSRGALSAAALAGEVGDVDPSRLDEVFSLFASAAGLPPGVTRELNRQEFVAAMRFFAPIRCMAEFRARLRPVSPPPLRSDRSTRGGRSKVTHPPLASCSSAVACDVGRLCFVLCLLFPAHQSLLLSGGQASGS